MSDPAATNKSEVERGASSATKAPLQAGAGGNRNRYSRSRGSGSTHETISGLRRVKGYPVTRDELFGLGGAGFIATTCFSIGGGLVGRSIDIQKDLELNTGVPTELKIRWQTKEADYWLFGWVLIAIGAVAIIAGSIKIGSIIRSTVHPDE